MLSYTSVKVVSTCYKLFEHYSNVSKEVLLPTSAMEWGKQQHVLFQDRLLEGRAKNAFEQALLVIADDWNYEVEFQKEFKGYLLHGFVDLYSPQQNVVVEYKTGGYDPIQLDFYTYISNAQVYLYLENKDLIMHEYNANRFEKFMEKALNNLRERESKVSTMCAQCVLAHTCEILHKEVENNNLDAIIFLMENYKTRAELLKQKIDIPTDRLETQYHIIEIEKQKVYKLKRGIPRVEVVKKIIEAGDYELLDFTPADLREKYSEYIIETEQTRKTIKRRDDK